jgi:hypothetical protein
MQVTTKLLTQRRDVLMPLLDGARGGCGKAFSDRLSLVVSWELQPGRVYHLFANLSDDAYTLPAGLDAAKIADAEIVYTNHKSAPGALAEGSLPGMTVLFALSDVQLFAGLK